MLSNLKTAIVHYWLVNMRGGEKVVESFCNIFPAADIYTLIYNKEKISNIINQHNIKTSFIQNMPFSIKKHQFYLPLMPFAVEQFDVSNYDLVISSESGIAKGVLTKPQTCHICYCHSPMRYLWNMYFDYLKNEKIKGLKKKFIIMFFNYLRLWDLATSARVDYFIANSENVKKRIKKYYRRDAVVINPPVDIEKFKFNENKEDFYLIVSQLVSYKRIDIAINAFNELKKELIIIGEGSEYKKLKKIAKPNIKFLGWKPTSELIEYYARAKAFIFPGEEDFGITPVEAMASGTPVIAFGAGGALETVIENKTGLFFKKQDYKDLIEVVELFESKNLKFDKDFLRQNALKYSKKNFENKIFKFIEEKYSEYIKFL